MHGVDRHAVRIGSLGRVTYEDLVAWRTDRLARGAKAGDSFYSGEVLDSAMTNL